MKNIPVGKLSAIVDDADYDKVSALKWYPGRTGNGVYAITSKSQRMHKVIAPGGRVYHLNGNGLDNRRTNLRLVIPTQKRIKKRRAEIGEITQSQLDEVRARLLRKYKESESGCWEWTAGVTRQGYGAIGFKGIQWRANRVAWMVFRGPIPPDLCVLHHCDNPRCINPDHLWLGTHLDNSKDCVAKGRNKHGKRKVEDSNE